jgi:hypothetical protein
MMAGNITAGPRTPAKNHRERRLTDREVTGWAY